MPASLEARERSRQRAEMARKLRSDGAKHQEIATRLGVSRGAVHHLLNKTDPEPWTCPVSAEALVMLYCSPRLTMHRRNKRRYL